MILLIPLVLAGLGKVGGRLPLVLRYAVRDAARHRTRTVPAVAAVAATVAGVVALGDRAHLRRGREPGDLQRVPVRRLSAWSRCTTPRSTGTSCALRCCGSCPRRQVTELIGLADSDDWVEVTECADNPVLLASSSSSLGANIMVSDGSLPVGLIGIDGDEQRRAEKSLAAGGAVVFVSPGERRHARRRAAHAADLRPRDG